MVLEYCMWVLWLSGLYINFQKHHLVQYRITKIRKDLPDHPVQRLPVTNSSLWTMSLSTVSTHSLNASCVNNSTKKMAL